MVGGWRVSGREKEERRPMCGSSRADERVLGVVGGLAGSVVDRRFISSLVTEPVLGAVSACSSFVVGVAFVSDSAVSDEALSIAVSSCS